MHPTLTLSLLRWSAWTPGATSADEWRARLRDSTVGAVVGEGENSADTTTPPKVEFVPPLLRRRLSTLSRAALAVAADCLGTARHDCRTIFASPHGEVSRTVELLQQLAAGEPLSPNAFSLSVHNTASGLYAMATGNRAASTALAAGRDTLPMAFIEAAGRLARDPQPLLLVFVDEPLPDFYRTWQPQPARSFALALLLAPVQAGHPTLQLQRETTRSANADQMKMDPIEMVPLLLGTASAISQGGERGDWRWSLA